MGDLSVCMFCFGFLFADLICSVQEESNLRILLAGALLFNKRAREKKVHST